MPPEQKIFPFVVSDFTMRYEDGCIALDEMSEPKIYFDKSNDADGQIFGSRFKGTFYILEVFQKYKTFDTLCNYEVVPPKCSVHGYAYMKNDPVFIYKGDSIWENQTIRGWHLVSVSITDDRRLRYEYTGLSLPEEKVLETLTGDEVAVE